MNAQSSLDVRCPECDARPGERCYQNDGASHRARLERVIEEERVSNTPARPAGCTCHGRQLCDMHRQIGLAAIAAIRNRQTP